MNFFQHKKEESKSSNESSSIGQYLNFKQNNDIQRNYDTKIKQNCLKQHKSHDKQSETQYSDDSYSSLPEHETINENINHTTKNQSYQSLQLKNKLSSKALAEHYNHVNGHDHLTIPEVVENCIDSSVVFVVPEIQDNHKEEIDKESANFEVQYLQEDKKRILHCNMITFTKCKKFTQQQVLELNGMINQNNLGIKLMVLQFEDCKGLKDEDLVKLGSSFGGFLTDVEYLNIQFLNCKSVTIEGIKNLILGIVGRETIVRNLTLKICKLKGIKHEHVNNFIKHLQQQLINLDEIKLDIIACDSWTKESTKTLYEGIHSRENLSRLNKIKIRYFKKPDKSENYFQDLVDYIREKLKVLREQGATVIYDKVICYKNKLLAKHSQNQNLPLGSIKH